MNNEFYHHGIQGQKWGKRNGPPYPLGANDHSAAEKKAARNNTHNKLNNRTDQTPVRINRSSNVKSNKNRQTKPYKLTESEKSIARAYRKNAGMSKIDAERMAVYQSRAKKIAIGVAVGALVVGTAYVVVKTTQDPYKDFTILPGTKIQRITPFGDNDVREQFYGAINKQDKNRYIWGMADWKQTRLYQQELIPKKPIKVAGINTCEKLFNEMRSGNPEFNKALDKDFNSYVFQKLDYRKFNRDMVEKYEYGPGNSFQIFQDALKKKGYGALIDHNDAAGGGWGTERPVIFFAQQDNLQSSVKELTIKKISEARRDYARIQRGREFVDQHIGTVAAAGGISTLTTGLFTISGMMTNREIIKEYKSLHPNTNLSDSKILNIFDRSD